MKWKNTCLYLRVYKVEPIQGHPLYFLKLTTAINKEKTPIHKLEHYN